MERARIPPDARSTQADLAADQALALGALIVGLTAFRANLPVT